MPKHIHLLSNFKGKKDTSMDISNPQLLLKRVINVKAIVTPLWKEEVTQQLQSQINQTDQQLQQLDVQGQRVFAFQLQENGTLFQSGRFLTPSGIVETSNVISRGASSRLLYSINKPDASACR